MATLTVTCRNPECAELDVGKSGDAPPLDPSAAWVCGTCGEPADVAVDDTTGELVVDPDGVGVFRR